jgi:2,3-bisphosphoglycerate-independent phosphoglycerate mutase
MKLELSEMKLDFISKLKKQNKSKIVFLIIDGLGGLPLKQNGLTELESANIPNLDSLASKGICGLQEPIGPGITPGSGPGHLSLFGYDPIKYQVGRGVLAALGVNFDLKQDDIAARGNFCTIDKNGLVLDRRAGRISTNKNEKLCNILRNIKLPGINVFIQPLKEHRFLLVLRGNNLSADISDTDPQAVGVKPLKPNYISDKSKKTSDFIIKFIEESCKILKNHNPANMILLRGFSKKPNWPSFEDNFGLKSAAIASYPMYKGISRLLGMKIIEVGNTIEKEFRELENNWNDFDFFYIHIKGCDSAGEDGDFNRKIKVIEEIDKYIPRLLDLNPNVIIVTGDHSTPSLLKYHSWHPVPVLLWSKYCRSDNLIHFGERECIKGSLGPRFPAVDLMALALAHAKRLDKFGA